MNKIIATLLIIAFTSIILSPLTPAQEPTTDYELTVSNPVVFLASSLTGNVSGPNGTEYQIIMVNMTSYETFIISGGIFNSSHNDNYTRFLNADYYPAGRYTLNLTVDGETIIFLQISVVYNQMFVFWQKLGDIAEELTRQSYIISNLLERMDASEEHQKSVDWVLFVETVLLIFIIMMVLYFVVFRFFKVRYAYSQVRHGYNLRRVMGPDIDPVVFSDIEHKLAPKEASPNHNPIMHILLKSNVGPALAEEWSLDVFADFGMSVVIEKEMAWREKRKIKKQKEAKAASGVKE